MADKKLVNQEEDYESIDVNVKPDYRHMSAAYMIKYIAEKKPEDKAWFKSISMVTNKEKKSVDVLNEEGQPVTYTDKNGKIRVKKKMVEVEDGKEVISFSLLVAKREFCKRYMPELLPNKKTKNSIIDMMKDW